MASFIQKIRNHSQIKNIEKQIREIEAKMSRSQSAIITANINGRKPDENDVTFHQKYLKQIDELRARIRELQK